MARRADTLHMAVGADGTIMTLAAAQHRVVARGQLVHAGEAVRIEGLEVDFLWRSARLVVEVAGFQVHSSRASFERDRLRDAVPFAAGYRVLRVTWKQLAGAPEALLVRLAQALSATS